MEDEIQREPQEEIAGDIGCLMGLDKIGPAFDKLDKALADSVADWKNRLMSPIDRWRSKDPVDQVLTPAKAVASIHPAGRAAKLGHQIGTFQKGYEVYRLGAPVFADRRNDIFNASDGRIPEYGPPIGAF